MSEGDEHIMFIKRVLRKVFPGMSAMDELRRWIEREMPALDAELGPMLMDDVRERLNRETGLNILSDDDRNESAERFLAALRFKAGKQVVTREA